MRTFVAVVLAAAAGALALWCVQRLGGSREQEAAVEEQQAAGQEPEDQEAPQEGGEGKRKPPPPPTLAARPVFYAGTADEEQATPARAVARKPGESVGLSNLGGGASRLEEERRLASTTFDSGDRVLGMELLEKLYSANKESHEVDLSGEVERLFEAETRFPRRREFAGYLARRGSGQRPYELELERSLKHLSRLEAEPERAPAAWEALSLAYELAPGEPQRRETLRHLEPLLERMIFAGRHSPLLQSYSVVSGDSLSIIAERFGTTVDALKRLNKLEGEVIQPRKRLRVITGKVVIHVDKSDFRLWVTVDGRVLLERPIGVGLDNATPAGQFVVAVRQKDPAWFRPGEPAIPAGDPRNVLGSRWLGFKATSEFAGYGIHGTTDASSVGKESSAGCIRLRNEDIELVYDFVPLGTQVVVGD